MRRKIGLAVAVAAIMLALAGVAQAGGRDKEPDPGRGGGMRLLLADLPAEQQAQVRAMVQDWMAASHLKRLELEAREAELAWLLADPKADQGRVNTLVEQVGALQTEMLRQEVGFRRLFLEKTGKPLPVPFHLDGPGRGGMRPMPGPGPDGPEGGRPEPKE